MTGSTVRTLSDTRDPHVRALSSFGGGDYLFPKDQLLLVILDMKQPDIEVKYKKIEIEGHRHLSKLKQDKNYLVWFHHLWRPADLKAKRSKSK